MKKIRIKLIFLILIFLILVIWVIWGIYNIEYNIEHNPPYAKIAEMLKGFQN
ncbi:MAG: hypothetical protein K6U11_10020 [bacterium]|nr:hypothetical protein [bacterium]